VPDVMKVATAGMGRQSLPSCANSTRNSQLQHMVPGTHLMTRFGPGLPEYSQRLQRAAYFGPQLPTWPNAVRPAAAQFVREEQNRTHCHQR
jgi:hypothetical protein